MSSINHMPYLNAFLAGWTTRSIGASMPKNLGQYKDSFSAGWREADHYVAIWQRENNPDKQQNK